VGGGARGPDPAGCCGLAPITRDNRRIVVQEWLAEAFTMWGIAAIVIVVTAAGGADAGARVWV
jgi:hypothetical protein